MVQAAESLFYHTSPDSGNVIGGGALLEFKEASKFPYAPKVQ